MKFGLMFFAASDAAHGRGRYDLLLDSARFADEHGFSSVWLPERHFTRLGGLYPNPSVLHAALAVATRTVRLHAGSVVAPLHHPARIAEEWSIVDNLSRGRVGVSFASGWNPDDFIFFPDRYESRHERVFDTIAAVQRLWKGETIAAPGGGGQTANVRIYPTPVQSELPVWVTAAGNPRTFERAGAVGANLLTHLLDQDEDVLASRLATYRDARAKAGFDPAAGEVTLMLHTYVGADEGAAREDARRPYCEYIKANLGLLSGLARSRGRSADLTAMSAADQEAFVNYLYERFASERGLIGTPESCAALVSRLGRIGVTELACLLDFGPSAAQILANLPHLARLKDLDRADASAGRPAAAAAGFVAAAVQARCERTLSGREFHDVLRRHGIDIDEGLPAVRTVWRRDGEALASIDLGADGHGYHVPPAALDACSRILAAALPSHHFDAADGLAYVPSGMHDCRVYGSLSGEVWSHATMTAPLAGDVRVFDAAGRLLAAIDGLCLEAVASGRTPPAPDARRLLYERRWEPAPLGEAGRDASGTWLVAGEGSAELARLLSTLGGTTVTVPGDGPLRGIVYAAAPPSALPADADAALVATRVERALRPVLDLVAVAAQRGTPIWIVTRGAVSPVESAPIDVTQAPLWGLGRVIAVERPGALGGLIDLDPGAPADAGAREAWRVISTRGADDMIAFRDGAAFVPRLGRLGTPARETDPVTFAPDETVLVTGGTGGLGLRLAEWLAGRGASHLLLVSRQPPSRDAQTTLDRLAAAGVDVATVRADVASVRDLRQRLDESLAGRPPLRAVFHLAGVLDDGRLETQTWDRFARVLAAKVDGAWNLHRLTAHLPLRAFVLFSSMASLVAAPGQGNYAAANAFLDALARHRRLAGLPALAVNWGPWADAGHAATAYGRQAHAQLAAIGIGALGVDEGLSALDVLLRQDRTQAAAVAVTWQRLFDADPAAARLGLLADFAGAATPDPAPAPAPASPLVDELRALPVSERRPRLLRLLSDLVVAALKLRTAEPIDPRQRLFDLGIDSILALEMKDELERRLGQPLSATLLFVHPTLDALCAHLLDTAVGTAAPAPAAAVAAAAASPSEEELTAMLLREIEAGRGH